MVDLLPSYVRLDMAAKLQGFRYKNHTLDDARRLKTDNKKLLIRGKSQATIVVIQEHSVL